MDDSSINVINHSIISKHLPDNVRPSCCWAAALFPWRQRIRYFFPIFIFSNLRPRQNPCEIPNLFARRIRNPRQIPETFWFPHCLINNSRIKSSSLQFFSVLLQLLFCIPRQIQKPCFWFWFEDDHEGSFSREGTD